jgi:hypothetical protein
MSVIWQILGVLLLSVLLFAVLRILRCPHKQHYHGEEGGIYSLGSASETVRSEIIEQLNAFQTGYLLRDTAQLEPFMEQMFSQDNTLVLGTMPNEILLDREGASRLVRSDWKSWGDCTFLMENAHVSAAGDAAWVTTRGHVRFDLSRLLVLPLRLSAVMVRENGTWKFQFMQFQFDLDPTLLLVVIVLLALGLLVGIGHLVWSIV